MKPPAGFHFLCQGLHQGVMRMVDGSVERLAKYRIEFVRTDLRPDLQTFIVWALAELSPSEIKGLINREKTEFFFKGHGAAIFLRAVLAAL